MDNFEVCLFICPQNGIKSVSFPVNGNIQTLEALPVQIYDSF